ncbi:MAG TPA: transglycosylase domain-containing protein [Solirubrobacteraceae bacterium]|nr:transglycosylase domain-containing protein [Solirubrobacteraceae bacterium]
MGRGAVFSLGVVAVLAGVAALGFVGYILSVADSTPNINSLKPADKGANTIIYAADGSRLGVVQSDQLRDVVPEKDIPIALRQATVAIEDQRFYQHHGVDFQGIVRAAIKNVTSGKQLQGGSTITQQLVRNLYISPEHTFKRKIIEAKLAEELEKKHPGKTGKEWILTQYLNDVSYGTVGGQTAVGIQAASRLFFAKPAKRLTLPEAALIAGLPQAPSEYNPFFSAEKATARRNDVLSKMAKQHMITPAQAAAAMAAALGVKHNRFYTTRHEDYFFDFVKQQLIDRYGVNTVRRGGLKVYTTIQPKLQKAARAAIAGQLNQPHDPSSAIVTIDPKTGFIKAMVSSGSYGKNKFNYAAQGHRQPGSTFKVMVLMTALKQGVDPKSTTYDSHELKLSAAETGFGPWHVQTYAHSYSGTIDVVQATLQSDNTVYAQLDLDVGPKNVRKTAKEMGITSKLQGYPAEGLGGLREGVSPLEMADAYATIASGGVRHKAIAIRKVTFRDGRTVDLGKPAHKRIFEDGVAAEATKILEQNIQKGTGTAAGISCPAAGKTGTTDSFTDGWFIGFTPKLTTAVWVGYPNSRVSMTNVHGIQVAGGTFPAQIWHDYMNVAAGSNCASFPPPKTPFRPTGFSGKFANGSGGSGSSGSSSGSGSGKRGGGSGAAKKFETQGKRAPGHLKRYDKRLYESPPQVVRHHRPAPAPPAPAPAPPPGQ